MQRALRDGVADALDLEAKGRGVHGLAVAIREKFAAANAGPEAVSSVLETINRALDDAGAKLAAQGVSQEQIDAGIERFRNKLAREIGGLSDGSATAPAPSATLEKSAIAASEVVRERFSLDVVTAEGDKVSIRFKTLSVTQVAAAQVSDGTNTATAIEGSVISRGRFKLEVTGDLNDAERAAIGALLDKVDGIATDFFGGDVQAAFAAAARVSLDSEALSAFDLNLSYSRSLSAVQTYSNTARLGGQPAASPKPAEPKLPVEASVPVEATEPMATDPATPVIVTPADTAVTDPVTPPASEGTPTAAAAIHNAVKAASARETITSFAKDVLERLDQDDESKSTKFSLRWKVEFMIKAFGSVALNPVEQAAADALGIALKDQAPALI